MEHLLLFLLKLVLKLVIYAVTGKWPDLDKLKQQLMEKARAAQAQGAPRERPVRPVRERPARKAKPVTRAQLARELAAKTAENPEGDAAWPFRFEDEVFEAEPYEEDEGGEMPVRHHATFHRHNVSKRAFSSAPAEQRSISSAVRDPRTVRSALVLGAALGRRGSRH